jgi:hypothetical protein
MSGEPSIRERLIEVPTDAVTPFLGSGVAERT